MNNLFKELNRKKANYKIMIEVVDDIIINANIAALLLKVWTILFQNLKEVAMNGLILLHVAEVVT